MRMNSLAACLLATSVVSMASANELTWTGAGDGTTFADAGNWDGTPTGGSLDMGALVDDFVIDDASACVGCPGGVSQLTWVDPNVGSFSLSAGTVSGATGLRYTTMHMTGGNMTRMFLLNVVATISGDAELTMTGAGNPINLSTVEFESESCFIHFTGETPDAIRAEHLAKFTSFGLPAIEDVTITIEADDADGAVVRAIKYTHETQTLTWTGAGDGDSFDDLSNWDGAPFGGTVDLNNLVDRYIINEGAVGGSGVGQLYFYGEGALVMNGGSLGQNLLNATQGVTGGLVEVTGGVLNRQFLSRCDAFISGSAQVVLNGPNDPVPHGAVIDLSGESCSVTFLNQPPDIFRVEHLAKFRVDGKVAIEGENLLIEAFGDTGCIVTALGSTCPADINGDEVVDGADLTILLGAWGSAFDADIDGSGLVDGADLTILLGSWGLCPVDPCEDVVCDDEDPCTIDYCDPKTGECVFEPIEGCGEGGCGDPKAGSCYEANGTPACSDAACCEAVCEVDSFCCETEWDASCVAYAAKNPDC